MAAKTANVTVCIQPNIKEQAETILERLGIPVSVFYEWLCFDGGILTANQSKATVCRFRVTKKRRIATTLLSCSEDGAMERYSIICCTFSFCLLPLFQWLHRR